jgi:hypothetical protein
MKIEEEEVEKRERSPASITKWALNGSQMQLVEVGNGDLRRLGTYLAHQEPSMTSSFSGPSRQISHRP